MSRVRRWRRWYGKHYYRARQRACESDFPRGNPSETSASALRRGGIDVLDVNPLSEPPVDVGDVDEVGTALCLIKSGGLVGVDGHRGKMRPT